MFEKLKKLNRKWYLLLVLVILLGGGGSFAAKYYLRQQFQKNMQANAGVHMTMSVEQDLLYLDNTSSLKLSPDQAKAILPLVEKMSNSDTNSSVSINDLAKQVYESLTPVQYQALTHYGNPVIGNVEREREDKDTKKDNRREDNQRFEKAEHYTKDIADPKADALQNIVINMLKERSSETTTNLAS
ncbi:hypothetical protein Desor_2918 [Desulfosporosinus orientis DSM 765]|uniref:Uncharacterized protein n=1 Tax=Desulfosporosinus orientis (strain ATCC 19365 / DSM 765 / NCIMB 8382 / VKM B-1628 / Singapore I) TaxID=768706 RepID=G7WFK4_DESOD|nr:hypothetical protein [Desulfosporosinus orientis]AET68447.1 hypothetical protein Desor_2918 [Desulfosporosinus orientis DSM 765]